MKTKKFKAANSLLSVAIAAFAIAAAATPFAQAANITKASSGTDLTAGASWTGSTAPGSADVATWDTASLGAGLALNSGTPNWLGIKVNAGASDPISIGSGGTLTLGASGIDLSASAINATISSGLTLGAGSQAWNIASGKTLTLNSGTFIRSAGATLNLSGSGAVASTMTGLSANDISLPLSGIVGPWLTTGTGASTRYASLSGGNLVAYTGFSAAFNWSTTLPNLTNMEVSATTSAIGVDRMCNTLRWTGAAASQPYGSGSSANRLILNGLMNAGTGLLQFTRGAGTPRLNIGTNNVDSLGFNELVLHAANAGITINGALYITNQVGTGGAVVIVGPNTVTFAGTTNTYCGATIINSGTLALSGGGTTLGQVTNALIVNGGTLNLGALTTPAAGAVTINGGTIQNGMLTASTSIKVNNSGAATVSAALAGSVALTKSGVGTLTLSGANTFTGNTTINAGKLVSSTAGSAATAITIASSATNGILLAAADGQWVNSGTVTQNAGSELDFDFSTLTPSVSTAPMNIAGLTINATTVLKILGLTANFGIGQTYPLISWSGSGPATTNGIALVMPTRLTGHLAISGNTLNLIVDSNTGPLSWNTGNGTWNTSTPNWLDSLNNLATYIDGGDSVLFDDASGATGNPTITLNSALSPVSTTMNSASHNYTLNGSGGIAGGGVVTIQNGTLTLATTNTYTGGTVVNNGTLQLSGGGTLGASSGAVTINGGTLDLGTTSQTSGAVTISGGTIQNGTLTGASYTSSNSSPATVSATLAGTGGLTVSGTGTLTLAGSNSLTGTVTLNTGTVLAAHTNALNSAARVNLPSNLTGTLIVATDGGDAPIKIGLGSGATVYNLVSDRVTPGAGISHPLSVLAANGLGGGTLNFTAGANVTSGTAAFSFDNFGLGAGSVQTTILNPSTASVTIGAVSKFNNTPAQTLQLDGMTTGNQITGIIANGTATVSVSKQNSSTWTLAGANTYTGGTTLGSGQLNLNNNSALGTGALTISSGTLDNTSAGDVALGVIAQNWNGDFTYAGSLHNLNLGNGAVTLNATPQVTVSQNTLTIGGVIAGAGQGLTKSGNGILVLPGLNTYSGNTAINAGKLISTTSGASASPFTVANGATNGILVVSTDGSWTNTSSLTQDAGSELVIDFGSIAPSASVAPVNVGTFTASATVRLRVNGAANNFTVGHTYPLVTWSSGPADASAFALIMPTRLTGHLAVSGSTLNLIVDSNTGPISWNTGSGFWNTTTPNWLDSTLASAIYVDGSDSVLFNSASGATGNPTVTLNSFLSPVSVTMNSASHNYTISGAGGINGSGTLAVQNGTLTLATSNSYSGGTAINGGKLQLSGSGTMGSGPLTVAAALDLGSTSQSVGAVTMSGGAITNGSLTSASYSANNAGPGLISASLNGTGGLTKTGNGTLTLTASNGFTGNLFARSGETIIDAGGVCTNITTWISIGQIGTDIATLTLKGNGSLATTFDFNVGDVDSAIGTLNLQDSAVVNVQSVFVGSANAAGSTASGTINMNGGTLIERSTAVGNFSVGGRNTANAGNGIGVLNVTNGYIFAACGIRVGDYGTGTVNQFGGLIEATNGGTGINLHRQATGISGTYHLNGGTLRTEKVTSSQTTGTSLFYFNGGTLQAGNGSLGATAFMNNLTHAFVRNGGAIIDDRGYTVTISQTLEHGDVISDNTIDGGLTKLGAGIVTLSGTNTYTGNTTVNGGTLDIVQATLATNSTMTVASGAILKLDFAATNAVNHLVLNSVSQLPGIYNSNNVPAYITGPGSLMIPTNGPSGPALLTTTFTGDTVSLSWPAGQGWRLQEQTNTLSTGLGTNWVYLTDGSLSSTNISLDVTKPAVFFRLVYP